MSPGTVTKYVFDTAVSFEHGYYKVKEYITCEELLMLLEDMVYFLDRVRVPSHSFYAVTRWKPLPYLYNTTGLSLEMVNKCITGIVQDIIHKIDGVLEVPVWYFNKIEFDTTTISVYTINGEEDEDKYI